MRSGAEGAAGVDDDSERIRIRLFPRRPDPERADADRLVEAPPPILPAVRNLDGDCPAPERLPEPLLPARIRVRRELEAVGAVELLEAGWKELEHHRARLLGALQRDRHRDPAQPVQRNALFSFSK